MRTKSVVSVAWVGLRVHPELSNNILTLPSLLLQRAVFKVVTKPVVATFLSMLSQGLSRLNFGPFLTQALDLPGGSQFGYAPTTLTTPTDDSYCLFATQPYLPNLPYPPNPPAPSPPTLLSGAPTAGSPLPGAFSCVDASTTSTKPPPTPESFTLSYAGTTYVCQGTPELAPSSTSPIGRNLQPALAPVENAIADTQTAVGSVHIVKLLLI